MTTPSGFTVVKVIVAVPPLPATRVAVTVVVDGVSGAVNLTLIVDVITWPGSGVKVPPPDVITQLAAWAGEKVRVTSSATPIFLRVRGVGFLNV